MKWFYVLVLLTIGLANAQVPGFGGCPDFESHPDFDMNKFLGTWYEAERYVNIFEAGSRCVKTNYTRAVDGRYLVANEIMNRFTSIKRVLEGEIRLIVKGSESKLNIKYPNLPIPYESQMMILDTDYDSYAVMWSCSSLGIINTLGKINNVLKDNLQEGPGYFDCLGTYTGFNPPGTEYENAWIMTREKLAPGTVLQKAYGTLDKYKLSRTFFVKTDQNSCEIAEAEHAANNSAATDSDKQKSNHKKVGSSPKKGATTVTHHPEGAVVKPEKEVKDADKEELVHSDLPPSGVVLEDPAVSSSSSSVSSTS